MKEPNIMRTIPNKPALFIFSFKINQVPNVDKATAEREKEERKEKRGYISYRSDRCAARSSPSESKHSPLWE